MYKAWVPVPAFSNLYSPKFLVPVDRVILESCGRFSYIPRLPPRRLSGAFCILLRLSAVFPRISASFRVSVRLLVALFVFSFFVEFN